jgi:hypothetical protein
VPGAILQFRGGEDVDDAFGFVAGLQIALDERLPIAGNGSMFRGGDLLNPVADVGGQRDGDACA